jgi:hypothetical protein
MLERLVRLRRLVRLDGLYRPLKIYACKYEYCLLVTGSSNSEGAGGVCNIIGSPVSYKRPGGVCDVPDICNVACVCVTGSDQTVYRLTLRCNDQIRPFGT